MKNAFILNYAWNLKSNGRNSPFNWCLKNINKTI